MLLSAGAVKTKQHIKNKDVIKNNKLQNSYLGQQFIKML